MRPALLNPLFQPLTSLPGVGPRLAPRLARLVGPQGETAREAVVLDLLFHLPSYLIDRTQEATVATAPEGGIVTLRVHVDKHRPTPPGTRARSRALPGVP